MIYENKKISSLINTDTYPITNLSSDHGVECIERCHNEFTSNGLCVLPDFIRPDTLSLLADQANQNLDDAYFCSNSHNAYLTNPNNESQDHANQHQENTYVGSVPYDRLLENGVLKQIYHSDYLREFICGILGKQKLYRFADPLGACSINVFVDGGQHGWHFDESEFTITLMLQQPSHGGLFEYVPQIRGLIEEKEIVSSVLRGEREMVKQLPFTAGTLLVFAGQKTLHRVTKVNGNIPRLVPVLCFADQPNLSNSAEVQQLFWGRTSMS